MGAGGGAQPSPSPGPFPDACDSDGSTPLSSPSLSSATPAPPRKARTAGRGPPLGPSDKRDASAERHAGSAAGRHGAACTLPEKPAGSPAARLSTQPSTMTARSAVTAMIKA